MVRMFDLKLEENNIKNFKDVGKNKWYFETIRIATSNGYLKGYDDGEFKPEKEITREEIVTIIGRILKDRGHTINKSGNLDIFKDGNEVSDWSRLYMDLLIQEKIINGYEDNTIKPKNKTTRAEAAVMIYRLLSLYSVK